MTELHTDRTTATPSAFPRRILVAVTGLSPQVLTESLFALAVARHPPFVPTEIHVVSTREGAAQARLSLLADPPGWFRRLSADYGLPRIAFDDSHLHVLGDGDGRALDDIRTPADNETAADDLTEHIRGLTADPDAAVHVSIAGGRKTMGFYAGYALSLFGRDQDRLSHVLVSEPFESNRDFFYPTPYRHVIPGRDPRRVLDAAEAVVELAEIPFVSLRHGMPRALLDGNARFHEAVEAARASLGPPELLIRQSARTICAGGISVRVPPAELALLCVFARRALETAEPLAAPAKGVPDPDWAVRFLHEHRQVVGEFGDDEKTRRALHAGMDDDYFSQHLTKLRTLLKRRLGAGAGPYLIDDGGTRPRRYRLALPPGAIRFDV